LIVDIQVSQIYCSLFSHTPLFMFLNSSAKIAEGDRFAVEAYDGHISVFILLSHL